MRLFFALAPPAEQRREIAHCIEAIRGRPRGRLVPPQNLHLTLAFLGEIPAARVPELRDAALPSRKLLPFELEWGGFAAFPNRRRARVAALRVLDGARELEDLVGELLEALPADLRPHEKRNFRPHLTLVRFREPPPPQRLDALAEALEGLSWRSAVRGFELLRSHLEPSGARYERLEYCPLEGS